MPNRIPTPGISAPAVRKSPMAQAPAKPKATPLPPQGSKRPMVGNDSAVAKKVGKGSWNNGYTN